MLRGGRDTCRRPGQVTWSLPVLSLHRKIPPSCGDFTEQAGCGLVFDDGGQGAVVLYEGAYGCWAMLQGAGYHFWFGSFPGSRVQMVATDQMVDLRRYDMAEVVLGLTVRLHHAILFQPVPGLELAQGSGYGGGKLRRRFVLIGQWYTNVRACQGERPTGHA